MEIEDENGSKVVIDKSQKIVFGRGNGFDTTDPTVSRRHALFEFEHRTEPVVSFEVIGRNPIWVRRVRDAEVRVFRRSEKGELAAGDRLCVSGKRPIWYSVRNVGEEKKGERVLESESELLKGSKLGDIDVSTIDPVKGLRSLDERGLQRISTEIIRWSTLDERGLPPIQSLQNINGFAMFGFASQPIVQQLEKMVAVLLSAGAKPNLVTDPTSENPGGCTAGDLASMNGYDGLITQFRKGFDNSV